MSTRSMVGHYTSDDKTSWQAKYVHYDGYPNGVGRSLYANYQTVYRGNLPAMVELLMSERVGWSSLCGCDLSIPSCWIDRMESKLVCRPDRFERLEKYRIDNNIDPEYWIEFLDNFAPKSYYQRGEDGDGEHVIRSTDGDWGWVEYAYLFDLKNTQMDVYEVKNGNQLNLLAEISLDNDEFPKIEEEE